MQYVDSFAGAHMRIRPAQRCRRADCDLFMLSLHLDCFPMPALRFLDFAMFSQFCCLHYFAVSVREVTVSAYLGCFLSLNVFALFCSACAA